jgi:large subunit ribosomal protein L15
MKLNQLAGREGSRKDRMRVGRGIGSGKGKTGGRGVKGQKSRAGVSIKGFEGGQMPLYRRLPKRGFNNIFARRINEVNLGRIQTALDKGDLKADETVTAASLVKAGVLRRAHDGVRLLGKGEIKAKLNFEVDGASKSAIAAVEKQGGTVKVLREKKAAPEKKAEPQPKKGGRPAAKSGKETAGEATA